MSGFSKKNAGGDFKAKLEAKKNGEAGKLAKSLERMRQSLKKSFELLEKEKEKTASLIENAGEAIVMINNKNEVILFNPVAEKITGYKKEGAEGKKYYEVLKLFRKKRKEYVYTGIESEIEAESKSLIQEAFQVKKRIFIPGGTYFKNKYGQEIEINGNIFPLVKMDGVIKILVVIFQDVTKEKELERKKSEFISITSHQLRTPISSIRWYLEMLLAGDAGPLNKKQKDWLSEVYESTKRSITLINNLLDASRIESGKISIILKPTQIEEVINEVISDFSLLAKASNVKIIKTFEGIVSPKIKTDPAKVYQIIQNIVENAIHYSKGKGEIVLSLKKAEGKIVFSCKDSGIGIPEEDQKRMFERFFRASNTIGTGVEGSGIGLHICQAFTGRLGGKIWFESEGENKGTTFYLSLPAVDN